MGQIMPLSSSRGHQFVTGFGRVQLSNALAFANTPRTSENSQPSLSPVLFVENAPEGFVTRNQFRYYAFELLEGNANFSVTIAWPDMPASLAAAFQLVNDLDLVIYRPDCGMEFGNAYLALSSIQSADPVLDPTLAEVYGLRHGRARDRVNNVERVFLTDPAPGTYLVEVSSYNLPSGLEQFFALAVNFQRGQVLPGVISNGCPAVDFLSTSSILEFARFEAKLIASAPDTSPNAWTTFVAQALAVDAGERVHWVESRHTPNGTWVVFELRDVDLLAFTGLFEPDYRHPATRYLAPVFEGMVLNPLSVLFAADAPTRFLDPSVPLVIEFFPLPAPTTATTSTSGEVGPDLLGVWIGLAVAGVALVAFVGVDYRRKLQRRQASLNGVGLLSSQLDEVDHEGEAAYRKM